MYHAQNLSRVRFAPGLQRPAARLSPSSGQCALKRTCPNTPKKHKDSNCATCSTVRWPLLPHKAAASTLWSAAKSSGRTTTSPALFATGGPFLHRGRPADATHEADKTEKTDKADKTASSISVTGSWVLLVLLASPLHPLVCKAVAGGLVDQGPNRPELETEADTNTFAVWHANGTPWRHSDLHG